jgi:hypothetical protein
VFLPGANATFDDWMREFSRSFKLSRLLRLWYPISLNNSAFIQRHIFWKKVTADEREKLQESEMYSWVPFDKVHEAPIDAETAEIIHKLRKTSKRMAIWFDFSLFMKNLPFQRSLGSRDKSFWRKILYTNLKLTFTTIQTLLWHCQQRQTLANQVGRGYYTLSSRIQLGED